MAPSPCLLLPGLQASAEGGEVDEEALSVPLLEQNKPPQLPGREMDEMADVDLRPDPVSLNLSCGEAGNQDVHSLLNASSQQLYHSVLYCAHV